MRQENVVRLRSDDEIVLPRGGWVLLASYRSVPPPDKTYPFSRFGAGSFAGRTEGTLTPITSQGLPAWLPKGWSPLQAFWVEFGVEPAVPGECDVVLWEEVQGTNELALVRWDGQAGEWRVVAVQDGATTRFSAPVGLTGGYAVVLADAGAGAPPRGIVGQALKGTAAGDSNLGGVTASGVLTPATAAASRESARVTTQADVSFTNSFGPLPSGTIFRCEIQERYVMRDGTVRVTPQYEQDIAAFRRPSDRAGAALHARFPVRPLLLLEPAELMEGTVRVDVRLARQFSGQIIDNPAFVTTLWKDPVSGNWNDPARWSEGLPNATRIAVIDLAGTYTVTVNADVTAAALTMAGSTGTQTLLLSGRTLTLDGASAIHGSGVLDFTSGILQGSGVLTVGSVLNWRGGTMQGLGRTIIGPEGQLNLSGNAPKLLYRRLDSSGTNNWTGTGDLFLDNGEFNNLAGALFHSPGGANIRSSSRESAFNNFGTFLKTGANATAFNGVRFNNTGVVNLTEGGLSLNAGTNSGTLRIETNNTLIFNGGTYSFLPGSTFICSGTLQLQSSAQLVLGTDVNFGTLKELTFLLRMEV